MCKSGTPCVRGVGEAFCIRGFTFHIILCVRDYCPRFPDDQNDVEVTK